jgi:hypothetical protein
LPFEAKEEGESLVRFLGCECDFAMTHDDIDLFFGGGVSLKKSSAKKGLLAAHTHTSRDTRRAPLNDRRSTPKNAQVVKIGRL